MVVSIISSSKEKTKVTMVSYIFEGKKSIFLIDQIIIVGNYSARPTYVDDLTLNRLIISGIC